MHGQSKYTPTKQRHLSGLLSTSQHAWNPLVNGKSTWAHNHVIVIDCTAGNGYDSQGQPGSPIIINQWARQSYGANFKQLCCEQLPTSFAKLWHIDMPGTEVLRGTYQELSPKWLEELKVTKPVLGFVYCDPNGAQDLVEGLDFFRWLVSDRRFNRLDLIFHWSMAAYSRNNGRGNAWAQTPILDVVDELASLKRYVYMREPMDKWQWVFMQMMNTDKVRPVWKSERIMAYADWKVQFAERFTT